MDFVDIWYQTFGQFILQPKQADDQNSRILKNKTKLEQASNEPDKPRRREIVIKLVESQKNVVKFMCI